MNLVTVGRERFRVRRLFREQPYLEAEIELMADEDPEDLGALPAEVREAADRYLAGHLALMGEKDRTVSLPEDSTPLSYAIGALLQVPLPDRQDLLEAASVGARLRQELKLLEQEIQRQGVIEGLQVQAVRPYKVDPKDLSLN